MTDGKTRIYCSGPLFNDKEREEMESIARALETAGFDTFLPHRDGLEFSPLLGSLMGQGLPLDKAHEMWDRSIFALDSYMVMEGCRGAVVNLNGRVPDEGAVAEAAMAWTAGRPVVAYKSDVRSLVSGKDNAMVTGMFKFTVYGFVDAAVSALKLMLEDDRQPDEKRALPFGPTSVTKLGRKIWEAIQGEEGIDGVAKVMVEYKSAFFDADSD